MRRPADVRAHILECLPEIAHVVDAATRERVVDVFQMALDRSTWDDLRQIPDNFISEEPMGNLVSHNRTVVELTRESVRIMKSFGHDIDEQLALVGALLHDVGKIGVPDAILLKPGSLTEEEWRIMRNHTLIGHKMISRIKFLRGAADIVLYHHERWDGTGYPYGIAGEDIPLGARIFSVIDSFDAITSKRVYKEAVPMKLAKQEIERCAGSQFDPSVVEEFLKISDEELVGSRKGAERSSHHTSLDLQMV